MAFSEAGPRPEAPKPEHNLYGLVSYLRGIKGSAGEQIFGANRIVQLIEAADKADVAIQGGEPFTNDTFRKNFAPLLGDSTPEARVMIAKAVAKSLAERAQAAPPLSKAA